MTSFVILLWLIRLCHVGRIWHKHTEKYERPMAGMNFTHAVEREWEREEIHKVSFRGRRICRNGDNSRKCGNSQA